MRWRVWKLGKEEVPYLCLDCGYRIHHWAKTWWHREHVHGDPSYASLEDTCIGSFKDLPASKMVQYAAFLHPFKRRFDLTHTDTSALEPSTTSDNSNKWAKYGNIDGIPVNNPNETSHPEGNSSCEEPEVGKEKQMPNMEENNSKGDSDSEDKRGLMKSDTDSNTDSISITCWKRAKRNKIPEVEAPNKDDALDPPTRGECSPSDVLKTANQVADTIATGMKDL